MSHDATRAPLIAVVGCDGSGKSTVSEAVLSWARTFGRAEPVHLGKQSGNIGRVMAQWPLIGARVDRTIEKQSVKARGARGEANPGFFPALVVYAFVIRRRRRFQRMLALWRQGVIIVADRFPQLDVPGAYDGPLMSVTAPGNRIVRWLARRERAQFAKMTRYKPDLVIRLNVDLDTACARKPDHKRDALRRKIEATPLFTFGGADIVEIDSRQPLADVVRAAEDATTRLLVDRGYAQPPR